MATPFRSARVALFSGGLLLLALTACGGREADPAAVAGGWPQWRGPAGNGVSDRTGLPLRWGAASDNVLWKTELGVRGVSQPIAAGDRVFLTGARGDEIVARTVSAYDLGSGELVWETVVAEGEKEKKHHRFGSFSTPTPVTDGETVWAYFGGHLAALSRDGELRWKVEVDPDYWRHSRYGAASSPVLTERAVILFQDEEWGREDRESWAAAFDRRTGEELWRNRWNDTCCSYSTPVLRDTERGPELLLSTTPFLLALDPVTGERLWQTELPVNQVVPTLLLTGDLVIQPGSVHKKKVVAYRIPRAGESAAPEQLWQSAQAVPEMASSVIYNDLLFTVTDGGVMTCYEPETGKRVWRARLPKQGYRASIVAGDGKLYLSTLGSVTAVVAAKREFELLAENDLEEFSESSFAITDDCLLIRTQRNLFCIGSDGPQDDRAT